MITDPKFNELRGALQTLNSLIENTSIDDPSIDRLLELQSRVCSEFAKYANAKAEKLKQRMEALLQKVETDFEDLKQSQDELVSNVVVGIISGIKTIVLA